MQHVKPGTVIHSFHVRKEGVKWFYVIHWDEEKQQVRSTLVGSDDYLPSPYNYTREIPRDITPENWEKAQKYLTEYAVARMVDARGPNDAL